MENKSSTIFLKLLKEYYNFNRLSSFKSLIMLIIAEFMGGISLIMLIPLLTILNNNSINSNDKINKVFLKITTIFNLEVNLTVILIFFLITFLIITLIQRISTFINAINQQKFSNKLRTDFFNKLADCDWNYLRKQKSSDFIKIVTTDVNMCSNSINQSIVLISSIVTGIVNLLVASIVSISLTIIGLIVIFIIFFLIKNNSNLILENSSEIQINMKDIFSKITDLINGIKTTKLLSIETQQKENFSNISEKMENSRLIIQKRQFYSRSLFGISGAVFISLFIYIGYNYFSLVSGELILLIFIFSRLSDSFIKSQQIYQRILQSLPSYIDYQNTLNELIINSEKDESKNKIDFNKSIKFNDVSFKYNDDIDVLKDINFEINFGTINVLIGESGSGKTTVADLISGLITPNSGEILIDNKSMSSINKKHWRSQISYVNQDVFLYDLSIKENLLIANPKASDDDVLNSLKSASIFDFVKKLPDGINTIIGERGSFLSGGERQRLSIAIALIKKPKLLVMDESTSALDEKNERQIMDILFKLLPNITILIISHKKIALEYTQSVFTLKNGIIDNK